MGRGRDQIRAVLDGFDLIHTDPDEDSTITLSDLRSIASWTSDEPFAPRVVLVCTEVLYWEGRCGVLVFVLTQGTVVPGGYGVCEPPYQ
eukprot:3938601-Rhodomonas_salina.1